MTKVKTGHQKEKNEQKHITNTHARIIALLRKEYPDHHTLLRFSNPFELLVSVILSAQTTDNQVNKATPALFQRYPSPEALAQAKPSHVESLIFSTGFYKDKARNIIATAQKLVDTFGSQVPCKMEALVTLPGVGRKTAGVVRYHIFGEPAIIVDTHFARVSRRLGWTDATDPRKIEQDIARLFSQTVWSELSMTVNFHGRRICKARSPLCRQCVLSKFCPSANNV